jgi:hypothetical protein
MQNGEACVLCRAPFNPQFDRSRSQVGFILVQLPPMAFLSPLRLDIPGESLHESSNRPEVVVDEIY